MCPDSLVRKFGTGESVFQDGRHLTFVVDHQPFIDIIYLQQKVVWCFCWTGDWNTDSWKSVIEQSVFTSDYVLWLWLQWMLNDFCTFQTSCTVNALKPQQTSLSHGCKGERIGYIHVRCASKEAADNVFLGIQLLHSDLTPEQVARTSCIAQRLREYKCVQMVLPFSLQVKLCSQSLHVQLYNFWYFWGLIEQEHNTFYFCLWYCLVRFPV